MWCIPPAQDAAFVCAMAAVRAVYTRPYDPRRPVVCFDEKSKQLVREVRASLPARPGRPARCDYEYERNGTANLFVMVEPLRGWRKINVTARRTRVDFAGQVKELVDVHYPAADRVTLVMDNLNTHALSSLYAALPPAAARRLIDKLDVVNTPKHGSWLNIAEVELSALERQALDGYIPDVPALEQRVAAHEADRNHQSKKVDWQFTTSDARVKLRRLYPQLQ